VAILLGKTVLQTIIAYIMRTVFPPPVAITKAVAAAS
jgi:hypothetical protein